MPSPNPAAASNHTVASRVPRPPSSAAAPSPVVARPLGTWSNPPINTRPNCGKSSAAGMTTSAHSNPVEAVARNPPSTGPTSASTATMSTPSVVLMPRPLATALPANPSCATIPNNTATDAMLVTDSIADPVPASSNAVDALAASARRRSAGPITNKQQTAPRSMPSETQIADQPNVKAAPVVPTMAQNEYALAMPLRPLRNAPSSQPARGNSSTLPWR